MKIILHQSAIHFRHSTQSTDSSIINYIKSHPFYHNQIAIQPLLLQIKQKLKKYSTQNNDTKNKLEQLSLYLNNQKNKHIFQIYSIVLRNPKGVTYKDIDRKLNIGIVSVSHYCCRLKKMNFVGLKHQKNEKIVFPKSSETSKPAQQEDEQKQKQKVKKSQCKPFHFNEMSMIDNIWLNISSYQSYIKNGITNEQIKQKLNKTSETKLIMKMVDQVTVLYPDIERQMVSEGKVFENRFKNVTKQIQNVSKEPVRQDNDMEQKLSVNVERWLKEKFPQFSKQKQFLLKLINKQLNDYLTVFGDTKPAKRTCTPIKLNRYIKVLNSLNHHWPQTHIELKNYIIDEQKQIQNGIMHKRSILGILQGLIAKGILRKQQHQRQYIKQLMEEGQKFNQTFKKIQTYYYPLWKPDGVQINLHQTQQRNNFINKSKKNKVYLASLRSDSQIVSKVGIGQYKKQLVTRLLWASIQQLYSSKLKKAFHRIMFVKRSKVVIKNYEPETHIFKFLEEQNYLKIPKVRADSYQNFISQLDQLIQNQGTKQEPLNINYQVLKTFRKSQSISETQLRNRFGNSWNIKLEPLIKQGLVHQVQNGIWKAKYQNRYYV